MLLQTCVEIISRRIADATAQRFRKIAFQRGGDVRILRHLRLDQLLVQPDLSVGQQHRALWCGQSGTRRLARRDLFIGR
jgi:hypothetical protein